LLVCKSACDLLYGYATLTKPTKETIMIKLIAIILAAALSTGCATYNMTPEEKEAFTQKQLIALEKSKQGVSIGMSTDDVIASSWGRPSQVNRTTSAHGSSEQWVYRGFQGKYLSLPSKYLYFRNGKLTAIQN
jgi:hypothetical protein